MARSNSKYVCQQCSYESPRWLGKCPECGSWNSMVETVVQSSVSSLTRRKGSSVISGREPMELVNVPVAKLARVSTQISELDRVLGGGLVPGQVVLVAGEPGIGKSTLLLQVANNLGTRHEAIGTSTCFYASGEESIYQIKIRADRLGFTGRGITLLEETDVDTLIASIEDQIAKGHVPEVVIVDSIQTMQTGDLMGLSGSVGQIRECAYRLVRLAKAHNIPVFIVGHVTKEGTVAGPAVLMHIVDSVLWFEGDKSYTTRMLRAVKNRFGPTDEVGLFRMEEKGLIPIDNPQELFLDKNESAVAGSSIAAVLQGTRPVLVEIQALVTPTKMAFPKRIAQGFDSKKFELILAVLTRRCGLKLNESDCYANVAGGMNLMKDPSADLAIALAVASAYYDKPVAKKSVVLGELGLLGDVRGVIGQEKRIKEAKRLGYKTIISDQEVSSLKEAIETLK